MSRGCLALTCYHVSATHSLNVTSKRILNYYELGRPSKTKIRFSEIWAFNYDSSLINLVTLIGEEQRDLAF